jgi:fluoroquinolone transport system permease protein
LFPPALALFQGAFARNKVEGFAFIKGTGILAMVPALMILDAFQGGMQYVLGIFPNFWAIKGTLLQLLPNSDSANLSTATYFLIGVAYNLFILFAAYRLFLRKAQY